MKPLMWIMTGLVLLGVGGCRSTFEHPPVQVIPDMDTQAKVKAQGESRFFRDGNGNRLPVPGTVSRGVQPYPYVGKPELAVSELRNTVAPTREVLDRGRNRFETFCAVCHGVDGKGNGVVVEHGYPQPPSLHSKKINDYPDAMIFHIISSGQNAMPSYAAQITPEDRWATVMYLRALLRSRSARPSDLPVEKQKGPSNPGGAK